MAVPKLQERLLDQGAVLVYFADLPVSDARNRAAQRKALASPEVAGKSWTALVG